MTTNLCSPHDDLRVVTSRLQSANTAVGKAVKAGYYVVICWRNFRKTRQLQNYACHAVTWWH